MSGRFVVVVVALLLLSGGCGAPSGTVSGLHGSVDIGGRSLWIDCRGSGSPVVVIESASGAGTAVSTFKVADAVAQDTTVCRYDRAGYGHSDTAPHRPQTIGELVNDLAALLVAADVPGPYLLVGESLGAQIVLGYALAHEDLVAGLVILDTDLPTTDVSRDPLAGLLTPEEQADYFRGTETARARLAETESLIHPLPGVAIRIVTATRPDSGCPESWGSAICSQALARHIAFQTDWLALNPAGILVEVDAPPGLAGADDAVVREITAALDDLRAGE